MRIKLERFSPAQANRTIKKTYTVEKVHAIPLKTHDILTAVRKKVRTNKCDECAFSLEIKFYGIYDTCH